MSALLEDQKVTPKIVEPGDADRFSHYAPKDKITESLITGVPLIALCGKKWVPSRDPQAFPVCPNCKYLYENVAQDG